MAEFPTYEEMAKNVAEKALDDFLYNGKSIREWMQIIASEDCISRAEAIKALNCEISGSIESDIDLSKYKREFQEFANIILNAQEKAIQALPPVTPKPKTGHWIPVGERLPENQDDVLVWIEYIKDDWDCAYWGFAYYSLRFKKWVVSTNERNPIVKAWMPLPEPYEPTDSESEDKE